MRRLTTNAPKDNLETALNLFYIKDHETWVRGGGLAPEYADISLFDFIRRAVAVHIPDTELPEDNDDLSMMMAEWLMDDIDTAEGIMALLYTAAWAYAELRYRLAAYEDTGLGPEDMAAVKLLAASADHDKAMRLLELSEADEKGRLVVLPLPIGSDFRRLRSGKTAWPESMSHYADLRPALAARGQAAPGCEATIFFAFDCFADDVEDGSIVLDGGATDES